MNPVAVIVAAILSLAPIGEDRARAIAEPIAAAVGDEGFATIGAEQTALLMVAVAWHESSFARDVEQCRRAGDQGRAWTIWQLRHAYWGGPTPATICADPHAAARRAYGGLRRAFVARAFTVHGALAGYLGRRESDPEVSRRARTFERLVREAIERRAGGAS